MSETSQFSVDDDPNDEDGYNPTSAHYVTALPSGIISFHIKKIKNIDETHVTVEYPELYLRIRVGSHTKCTKTFVWTPCSKYVIIHDIKHFSVMLSRVRVDPANEVRLDLILVENPHVHRMIGHKDMHVYDIVKNLYLAGTYELKYRNNAVAMLDFEICFAYGIFGYGHSHQLQNRQRKIEDTVSHSYFFRSEPPLNRKQYNNVTMAPVPMNHPEFISFTEKAVIGSPAVREMLADRYNRYDMDVFHDLEKHEPVILARTMRRRLQKIQNDFAELSNRQERKKFLERLILRHEEESSTQDDQAGGKDVKAQIAAPGAAALHEMDQVAAPITQAYGEDDDHADASDVPELSAFLANAPGIQVRARMDRRIPSMSVLEEDDSGDEFEDAPSTSDQTPGLSSTATLNEEAMGGSGSRSKSVLTDIPGGNFMISFANKLRIWKSKAPKKSD